MAFTTRPRTENLGDVLRRANLHYSTLAKAFRAALQPTHHAKKHALSLQLSVSTQAAAKLDQRQISVLPLPILDLAPSPLPVITSLSTELSSDMINILAPTPRYLSHIEANELGQDIHRPARPALRCVIPSPEHASPAVSLDIVHSPAPEDLLCDFAETVITSAVGPVSTVGMESEVTAFEESQTVDSPCSSPSLVEQEKEEAFASLGPRIAVSGSARPRISIPAHLMQPRCAIGVGIVQHKLSNSPPRLNLPVDLSRMSWGSDSLLGPNSGSSRSSSCGPLTPRTPDLNHRTMAHASKRKASPFDDADDENGITAPVLDKRPRYERKPWVTPTTHYREHSRGASISSRRRF